MSHFTEIETQIKDIDALRSACEEMGFEVLDNAEARGFLKETRHGEYVIRLKGPMDIALNRNPDGCFSLSTDWWDGHVEKEVGPKFGRLLQMYGVHKATKEARRKGLTVHRKQKANGAIKLTIGGVA